MLVRTPGSVTPMTEREEWLTRLRRLRLAWPVRCPRRFSARDVALLREGLWPASLDERWVVWLDGDLLRVWRGATGECLYEAELASAEDGGASCQVLKVCDDPDVYARCAEDAGEIDRFEGVLALLLGRRREAAA